MLSLRTFRDKSEGLADLLNYSHLMDSGLVHCKDGSFLVGYFYRGPDIYSSTESERVSLSERVNAALSRLGSGWATWVDAVRLTAPGYPARNRSYFPDPISRMVDEERRSHFMHEGAHYEGQYAFVVQYTPPMRRKSKVADLVFDDDPTVQKVSVATRILSNFRKALSDIEDAFGNAVHLRRMESYSHTDEYGCKHLRDELVNYLHFCITGEEVALNVPPAGAYLDSYIGGRELWPGIETFKLGSETTGRLVACVTIDGFPSHSTPGMLAALDNLAISYRWTSRMIYLDQHEALSELRKMRRMWKQQVRGFFSQVFKTQGGVVNEDALLMTKQTETAVGEASSGMVAFGYYSPVIVLMDDDNETLLENARLITRLIQREGFTARVETINAVEAWLGALPGHVVPNIRRPMMHTALLSDLLPLAGIWTGLTENPCHMYPAHSPPLLMAATAGSTPLRLNLHVSDVGHTMIFGPTGAGKTTLLCTVAIQALRYHGVTIWSFDYKRGMLATVKACGGRHYDIADGSGVSFCPLANLDRQDDVLWAEDWIASCFQLQAGFPPNPSQRDAIHRAMLLLKGDEAHGARTMTHLVMMVQNQEVRDALQYYTNEGTLGGMLDAEEDSIAFGQFMAFEMEDLLALSEKAAIPVLLYLFRRFEKALKGQPTYLILDEAWIVFGHPLFRDKLAQWLRVTRSKNCAVVLATQNLSDANKSGLLDILVQACPTKIFLPNEEAEVTGTAGVPGPRDFYEAMGMNPQQISIIRTATKKRDYYLVQADGRRMFSLNLGPVALSFSGATSNDDVRAINALEKKHGDRWPYVWMDQRKVDYAPYLDPELEQLAAD